MRLLVPSRTLLPVGSQAQVVTPQLQSTGGKHLALLFRLRSHTYCTLKRGAYLQEAYANGGTGYFIKNVLLQSRDPPVAFAAVFPSQRLLLSLLPP